MEFRPKTGHYNNSEHWLASSRLDLTKAGRISKNSITTSNYIFLLLCYITINLLVISVDSAQAIPFLGPSTDSSDKQSTILPTDIPIQLSADRLSFKYETNTYTAEGNVTISQGNVRLRADKIVYDGNTGEVSAEGKVIVRVGADVVEADKISIKLAAGTGVIFNGKLLLTRHNIYLEGKKLEKTGDSSYKIEEGSFTTCDGTRPDWRIRGKDLDVSLEGYGILNTVFFMLKTYRSSTFLGLFILLNGNARPVFSCPQLPTAV